MIVLTGGPCSGKSSSLAYLTERLSDQGYMVFVIPETATLISMNGIDRRKMDRATQVNAYEEANLELQLAFEETYARAVNRIFPGRKKVILLDRGVMDIKAFVTKEDFRAMLKKKGLKEVTLRDRYTGVVHLVTAADGAEAFYTTINNAARLETPTEARDLDKRTRECWLGHPHLKIIDNRTDFEGKIRRVFDAISQLLGAPASSAPKQRFLVEEVLYDQLPPHQVVEVEQIYLKPKNGYGEITIKKRGQEDSHLYFLKRRTAPPLAVESEEIIDEQQFLNLRKLIDPKTEPLLKTRICFLWNNRQFELDRYLGKNDGITVLAAEPLEGTGDAGSEQPPFVSVKGNITDNALYSEMRLAKKRRVRRIPRRVTRTDG
jgi:thymidylate kinase/CYTH domain-containing protein